MLYGKSIWASHSLEFFYFSVIAYAIQMGHFRLKTKSRVAKAIKEIK